MASSKSALADAAAAFERDLSQYEQISSELKNS